MNIREIVFSNLNDAMENGYDISTWTGNDIVNDLKAYAEDCQDISEEDLLPHVLEWLREPSKRAIKL